MVNAKEISDSFTIGTATAEQLLRMASYQAKRVPGKDQLEISVRGSSVKILEDALFKAGVDYKKLEGNPSNSEMDTKAFLRSLGKDVPGIPNLRALESSGTGNFTLFVEGRENLEKLTEVKLKFAGSASYLKPGIVH